MITQEDITTIVTAVLEALQTNGKTIAQLTSTAELSEDDYIEVSGGKKVSYATLRDAIAAVCSSGSGTVEYDGTDEVTTFSYTQNTGVVTLKQKNRSSKTLTIPLATTSKRGLMSAADKTNLESAMEDASSAADDADTALANANQALTALDGKADLQSSTLAPMLKTTQWPDVMVYNIVPLWHEDAGYDWSSIPVGSIYLEDTLVSNVPYRKLYLKTSVGQQGIVDLGAPREGTIYCHKGHGTTYVWDQSADDGLGEFVQIGLYLAANGRLASKQMAPMVLASMGTTLDNVGSSGGIQFIYEPADGDTYFLNGNIYFKKSGNNTIDLGAPDKLIIYCNAHTDRTYRWTGSAWTEVSPAGSGGGGSGSGITGITMNGDAVQVSGGVANLGTVVTDDSGKANKSEMSVTAGTGANADKTTIQLKTGTSATVLTSHQDISGKANKSEMSIATGSGANAGKVTIQLKSGTSATVLTEHQSLSAYAKYVLCASQSDYDDITNKDSGTLYLIPESSS